MSTRKGKKVTIVDVAREAGTSYSTVSRVFSNSGKVAEETKERIIEVAERLGYVPNQQARSLVGGQTQVLGVLVPGFDNGYVSSIVNGIDDEIAGTEYNLLLYTTHRAHKDEVRYVNRITSGLAEGLIVVLPRHPEAYLSALAAKHFPYIFVDHEGVSEDSISISATNFRGAYDATKYLIELGHRRIAFITGILELRSGLDRLHGYRAALQDYGIEVDQTLIVHGDFLTESGYLATQQLLEVDPLPTAIFVSNDLMAFGAMNAITDSGLHVPQDISIIGFDNIPQAELFRPRLTTVHQPLEQMGRMATRMLLDQIENPEKVPHSSMLATELVIRDSCQPPRDR
jgi:LacI family transcriptional regulator